MPTLTVTLTTAQWQTVLNILSTAPYRDVAELIAAIMAQQTNIDTNTNTHTPSPNAANGEAREGE